jgi:hypothetical protein
MKKAFIIIICFLIIFFVSIYYSASTWFDDWKIEHIEDKENQILFANAYPSDGWNGATIELLNNGTFRYGNISEYKMGNFKIENDTLKMDKDYLGGLEAILLFDSRDTFLVTLDTLRNPQNNNQFRVHPNTNKTGMKINHK